MNSWGVDWGDSGFFRINRETNFVEMQFYEVQFIEAFDKDKVKQYNKKKTEEFVKKFPKGMRNLPYKCPKCNEESKIDEFDGSIFNAVCPKCNKEFKPDGEELIKTLYNKTDKSDEKTIIKNDDNIDDN
jgi:acetyl-CoA carboxylase beta subunit